MNRDELFYLAQKAKDPNVPSCERIKAVNKMSDEMGWHTQARKDNDGLDTIVLIDHWGAYLDLMDGEKRNV
jgi:hypothetical protein